MSCKIYCGTVGCIGCSGSDQHLRQESKTDIVDRMVQWRSGRDCLRRNLAVTVLCVNLVVTVVCIQNLAVTVLCVQHLAVTGLCIQNLEVTVLCIQNLAVTVLSSAGEQDRLREQDDAVATRRPRGSAGDTNMARAGFQGGSYGNHVLPRDALLEPTPRRISRCYPWVVLVRPATVWGYRLV